MSSSITQDLSGIVISQNQKPALASHYWTPAGVAYQEFYLPTNYTRGADADEQIVPPLSGFMIMASVTDLDVSVDWTLSYNIFGLGWIDVGGGTVTEAAVVNDRAWLACIADDPITVPPEALTNRWRFGITVNSGVSKLWYSQPNPLSLPHNAKVISADQWSPILANGNNFSFLFRILGLVADSGTDFLGNSFRSAVTLNSSENTSVLDADTDQYWLSKPNPSRFAVENLYFDMRPQKTIPSYGIRNSLNNPNFKQGTPFSGWVSSRTGTGTLSLTAVNDADFRSGGAHTVLTGAANGDVFHPIQGQAQIIPSDAQVTAKAGDYWAVRCKCRVNAAPVTAPTMSLQLWAFDNSSGSFVDVAVTSLPVGQLIGTTFELAGVVLLPTGTVSISPQLTIVMTAGTLDLTVGQFLVTKVTSLTDTVPVYFDGESPGHVWTGAPHDSPSVEIFYPDPDDNTSVVDRVLVDPVTPGVYFAVYYTSEGEPGTTPEEWDNKVWTRVPETFQMTKREEHVLPAPIITKYIKIEFTHLQAKSYSPGNFAKPVTYQKHPKWVLDYFLARELAQGATSATLGVGTTAIVFDAYDLAYNYYLDDLGQTPTGPFELDGRFISQVNSFLSTSDLSDRVDPIMLDKIRVALTPYRQQISQFADTDMMLGSLSRAGAETAEQYPVENPATYPDVAQLRDESVIIENGYPVMFFYLTCRHAYRVLQAGFENDRAYFVGVKEVSFTRENYTVAYDTDLYIESNGDLVNTARNDFSQVEGTLVV